MNPSPPVLYSLPKLHKVDCPMRPVVSYITAPAYKICNKHNTILPKLINFSSKYAIKNSLQLVDNLKDLQLPPNSKLVSFDVINLFPSILQKELLIVCLEHLNNSSNLNSHQKQELYSAIEVCIRQSYFQINNKTYSQLDGLPMGSPLSPLLSEIFMASLEKKIFNSSINFINKNVFYWARYVDDIFCIWLGTDRQLDMFLAYINSFHQQIQLTLEIEKQNSINFLDLSISRQQQNLQFQIYRKPTFTDTVIHAQSRQSLNIKLSSFHSMVHRLLMVPLSNDNF